MNVGRRAIDCFFFVFLIDIAERRGYLLFIAV